MRPEQEYNYCPGCGKIAAKALASSRCDGCDYAPEEGSVTAGRSCFTCGASAPRAATYCPSCGQPLTIVYRPAPPPPHADEDEPLEIPAPPLYAGGPGNLQQTVGSERWKDVEDLAGAALDPGHDSYTGPHFSALAWKNVNTARVFATGRAAERADAPGMVSPRAGRRPPLGSADDGEETLHPGAPYRRPGGPPSEAEIRFSTLAGVHSSPFYVRAAPTLAEGDVIAGRYRVRTALGSGGFANIYLVTDSEDYLQEEVVLKLVNENLMRVVLESEVDASARGQDNLIKAWRSKLKAWKVISEQEPAHIVRLLGVPRIVFERGDSYRVGMLMEHMPGGDLWQYLQSSGVPRSREQLAEMMRLFLSACRAVAVLHANGLLHRDIKPSNFLLNPQRTQCKLSDFELIAEINRPDDPSRTFVVGTPPYMAPECFDAKYSVRSDVFALGATLYHLLTGQPPRSSQPLHGAGAGRMKWDRPEEPTRLNPLVSAELNEIVMRCLDADPAARPSGVKEFQEELTRLGLTGDVVNIAPVNLARLLLTHLPAEDIGDLVESLEDAGFHSASAETAQKQKDIVEEYCYTASPYDVLKDNCTTRQLKALTASLGLKERAAGGRDDLIEDVLTAVGFLTGVREVPGIETTRTFLENLRLNLAHATTMDECVGMVQAGLSAVERTLDLLLSFYGQLLLGTGLQGFLKKAAGGKSPERLTFGEKLGALRQLCSGASATALPSRARQVFKFPIIPAEVFSRLGEVVRQRNLFAHSPHQSTRRSLGLAQRSGRQLLEHAVSCLTDLAQNSNVPRVVQIVSRQDDIFGRHFYLGRDDHGRSERIFTPLPLNVGRLYLFFPLTNPARINPLIFPFETPQAAAKD